MKDINGVRPSYLVTQMLAVSFHFAYVTSAVNVSQPLSLKALQTEKHYSPVEMILQDCNLRYSCTVAQGVEVY